MKNKHFILIALSIVLFVMLIIGLSMWRYNYREAHKNQFEFPSTIRIKNASSVAYLDTIAGIVINKIFQYDTIDVIIFDMIRNFDQDDYQFYGYIEKMMSEPHTYIIFVYPDYVRKDKIKFMTHELIHLEQMETGRLQSLPDLSGKIFNGDTIYFNTISYAQRRYEIDAEYQAEPLRNVVNKLIYDK